MKSLPAPVLTGLVLGLLIGMATTARADLASDMEAFFDSAGLFTNVTGAGAYQGQSAGYYTGGSLYARAPVRNMNLLTVQAPALRAGCGGIDLFAGGFGFVNSEELIAFMENLGANALGLLFQIGLSTTSPKLASLIQYFEDLANKANQFSMNSCESATALLAGILPQTASTQQVLCSNIGTSNGTFDSYINSWQNCGAGGDTNDTLSNAPREYKDQIPQGNLAWKALMKLEQTASDHDLAQMMMTLTGTLIVPPPPNDDSPRTVQTYEGIPINKNLINTFLYGGVLEKYYECRDGYASEECLDIGVRENYEITEEAGFATKIETELFAMLEQMDEENGQGAQTLTPSQVSLLESTTAPVLKGLTVFMAYNRDFARQQVPTFARIIALDILRNYITSSILSVATSTGVLGGYTRESTEKYLADLRDRRYDIERLTRRLYDDAIQAIDMQRDIMTIERTLISGLSTGLAQSYNWAKGIR